MKAYLDILNSILESPYRLSKSTRTGIDTISLTGVQFVHDMRKGFPLLTTKKMPMKVIATELEFFIKGLSDKKWLQERGCHIWDSWCNPKRIKDDLNNMSKWEFSIYEERRKELQKKEFDLGRIYGVQWRRWTSSKIKNMLSSGRVMNYEIDQLKDIISRAKEDPFDRRLLVSAWRPDELDEMALPPCHDSFQILSVGVYLDLIWRQRSVDAFLGLPFNIASYGLLLKLLSEELNFIPRRLIGHLGDVHIYENHMEQVQEQLDRTPQLLSQLIISVPNNNESFSIFKWGCDDFKLYEYNPHSAIKAEVAV